MDTDYEYTERKYTMQDVKRLHPEDGIVIRLRRLFWYRMMYRMARRYENSPYDNPDDDPFIQGFYRGLM